MSGFLLDTNHLSRLTDPRSSLPSRIKSEIATGTPIGTCVPVLCELEVGIRDVKDPRHYRLALSRLLPRIRIWPIDRQTASIYGDLFHDLRQRGRVLSQVDIMVAALAKQMNLRVLTTDRDFESVPGLSVENWLA